MATSGPALIFLGVTAVIFFFVFAALGCLFVAFVLGFGLDGGDCDLDSILEDEEKKKKKKKKKEEEEKEEKMDIIKMWKEEEEEEERMD